MLEDSRNYWIIPIMAFVAVGLMLIVSMDVRANTSERIIEPEIIIPKKISDKNPYVEFCDITPLDPPFWPNKLIQNATHTFNHEFCNWDKR